MKVKHGHSQEITGQLSDVAAMTIAQWIGSYTVIYNQKTVISKIAYQEWCNNDKPEDDRPDVNQQVAFLADELEFLKEIPAQIRRNAGSKWFEALNAAKSGIRKQPKVKPKNKKRNCYVTNELFDVQALDSERCVIQIKKDATKKNKGNYICGVVMPFPKEDAGKSFYLSRKGNRFWLSMSYDDEVNALSEKEVKSILTDLSDDQLNDVVVGYDLGVKRQVTGSDNTVHHLSESAQIKLKVIEARKVRDQKRYARSARANDRTQGTKKRKRTKGELKRSRKIAKYSEKKANIQFNNSHHISKAIAEDTPMVAVFEDLKINNMVRRAKAKQDNNGKWLKNGASAKTGLNKAILNSNMGQIRSFTAYKLSDRGKLMVKVKPHCSSQECSACGYTHKDNRKTQEKFKCLKCGSEKNADDNASSVLKKRGIVYIRSEAFSKEKTKRKISARRKQGQELASSGSGENVSRLISDATIVDTLNSRSTVRNNGLLEARRL